MISVTDPNINIRNIRTKEIRISTHRAIVCDISYLGEKGPLGTITISNQVTQFPNIISEASLELMEKLCQSLEEDVAKEVFNQARQTPAEKRTSLGTNEDSLWR